MCPHAPPEAPPDPPPASTPADKVTQERPNRDLYKDQCDGDDQCCGDWEEELSASPKRERKRDDQADAGHQGQRGEQSDALDLKRLHIVGMRIALMSPAHVHAAYLSQAASGR